MNKVTLTEQIFRCDAPLENPFQTKARKIVFVCSVGMLRSPTAQIVASQHGFNARAVGSDRELALIPLNANLIEWAEKIVFMNFENLCQSLNTFEGTGFDETIREKKVVWDIEDNFEWGDNVLFRILEEKMKTL